MNLKHLAATALIFTGSLVQASEGQRLHRLYEAEWKYRTTEYPEYATFVGVSGQNDKWTDYSRQAIELRSKRLKSTYQDLLKINRAGLSRPDQLSYDLLKYDLADAIAEDRFPSEYLILDQLDGLQRDVADLFSVMPTRNEADYKNVLARLEKLPRLIDQTMALLKEGLKKGITPPRVTLTGVPAQIDSLLDSSKSPLLTPFEKAPENLRKSATEVFNKKVSPAFTTLKTFLVDTYIPGSVEAIAMSALPGGADWYAYLARHYTTTSMTPKQIHEIGMSEVKRIRAEMDKTIKEAGFDGSFEEFTRFLRTEDRFYFETADELIRGYRDIAKRVDPELPKLFGKLPRLPYGVLPVPAYSEKNQPTAYYMPGAASAGRAGYFYANTYNLKARPKWEMEALALHEGVPGHHIQIALAAEMENVPQLRRYMRETAFVEGWGLYAESLGYDLGMYKDPYSKFGQLTYEMWRAIRLVVDTGMHSMGWTREQAIDFFKKNASKAEHDIIVEVDRYIAMPGQALAYKIGQLKIKELRERAAKQLGAKFDIRAFHDTILNNGAPPLSVLEAEINRWISTRR